MACGPAEPNVDTGLRWTVCDPQELGSGQLRVKRVGCTAELPSGSDGRRGDILLQNQHLSVVFRDAPEALSKHRIGGGTLIDEGEEAEDHFNTIIDGLDRLRVDANDMEAIEDIRRAAHTLKGAAGAVGSPAISKLAYRLETLLNLLLEQERGATEIHVSLCLEAGDLLAGAPAVSPFLILFFAGFTFVAEIKLAAAAGVAVDARAAGLLVLGAKNL